MDLSIKNKTQASMQTVACWLCHLSIWSCSRKAEKNRGTLAQINPALGILKHRIHQFAQMHSGSLFLGIQRDS
jgi:hypothetical protein